MTTFNNVSLFGGSLRCDIPSNFDDVSKIRQVPDNQEVFIDRDGFTTIIFDITECIGPVGQGPEVDGEALTAHLEDIVETDRENIQVWNSSETKFSKLGDDVPAYTLIATQTPAPEDKATKDTKFTAIILTLARLENVKTDILVTINVPHIQGMFDEEEVDLELGKRGELIGNAVEYAARIWETFKVKDWGLFLDTD